MVDLEAEIATAQNAVSPATRQELLRTGVLHASVSMRIVGTAKVFAEAGLYQPHEEGERHLLVPVRVADVCSPIWPRPIEAVTSGHLVDILAFPLAAPAAWALRVGAGLWLGAAQPPFLDPPPVRVHADPLSWLCSGCRGIAPLTHDPVELQRLLLQFRSILVRDVAQGRELERILERPMGGVPSIYVMVDDEDGA